MVSQMKQFWIDSSLVDSSKESKNQKNTFFLHILFVDHKTGGTF